MRKSRASYHILGFLLLTSSLGARAETEIPLKLTPSMFGAGTMTARCQVEDLDLECTIDTGANVSSLRGDFFAEKPVLGTSRYNSATGAVKICENIKLDRLGPLGDQTPQPLEVVRCSPDPGEKPKVILGLDYMKNKTVDFDLKKSRLVLGAQDESFAMKKMDLDAYGHALIEGRVGDKEVVSIMWDSGAGLTLVASDLVDRHPELFEVINSTHTGLLDTHGNPIVNRLVLVKRLHISEKRYVAEYAMAVDFTQIRALAAKNIDFILGYNILKQGHWRFNFAEQTWGLR